MGKTSLLAMALLVAVAAFGAAAPVRAEGGRYAVAGFDDADTFEDFFDAFQLAVAEGDKAGAGDLLSFPITVNAAGKGRDARPEIIATPKEFYKAWKRIFTPKAKKALAKQAIEKLFVNSKGVMVGDGVFWFVSVEGQERPSLVVNLE